MDQWPNSPHKSLQGAIRTGTQQHPCSEMTTLEATELRSLLVKPDAGGGGAWFSTAMAPICATALMRKGITYQGKILKGKGACCQCNGHTASNAPMCSWMNERLMK